MSSQVRDLYGEIMPSDSMSQTVETSSSWPPPISSIGALAKADEYIVVVNTELLDSFEPSGRAETRTSRAEGQARLEIFEPGLQLDPARLQP